MSPPPAKLTETDLYQPVKGFLEAQGYEVKGEVGAVDVMAVRNKEEPLIVELKTGFSLSLFHQGVARLSVTDLAYIAVPRGKGRRWLSSLKANVALARRIGLGLITVRLSDGLVQVHCDPVPYAPRKNIRRKALLLKEFAKREGDPNEGGATRVGLVTAYRQDALKIAGYLAQHGPSKGAQIKAATGVDRATQMMAADHYGWFERVERGIYALTPKGKQALP